MIRSIGFSFPGREAAAKSRLAGAVAAGFLALRTEEDKESRSILPIITVVRFVPVQDRHAQTEETPRDEGVAFVRVALDSRGVFDAEGHVCLPDGRRRRFDFAVHQWLRAMLRPVFADVWMRRLPLSPVCRWAIQLLLLWQLQVSRSSAVHLALAGNL